MRIKNCWKLKLNKVFVELVFFVFFSGYALGQNGGSASGLFFPVKPGEANYLSGTMGELRSTHFHAGIDIKTGAFRGFLFMPQTMVM